MKQKMGYEERIEAIRLREEEHLSIKEIGKRFHVSAQVIQDIVDRFKWNGAEGIKTKQTEYSTKFKEEVIKEILEKTLSFNQICAKNKLSRTTVRRWYQQMVLGETMGKQKKAVHNSKPPVTREQIEEIRKKYKDTDNPEMKSLLEENLYLHIENDYLKKLAALTQQEQEKKQK